MGVGIFVRRLSSIACCVVPGLMAGVTDIDTLQWCSHARKKNPCVVGAIFYIDCIKKLDMHISSVEDQK